MKYTQLHPTHAEILWPVVEVIDTLPARMRASGLTHKEAAEVRTRVDALNSVLNRHIHDTEAIE